MNTAISSLHAACAAPTPLISTGNCSCAHLCVPPVCCISVVCSPATTASQPAAAAAAAACQHLARPPAAATPSSLVGPLAAAAPPHSRWHQQRWANHAIGNSPFCKQGMSIRLGVASPFVLRMQRVQQVKAAEQHGGLVRSASVRVWCVVPQ